MHITCADHYYLFVCQQIKLLGDRALRADVLGYLNEILDSPFFREDRVRGHSAEVTVQLSELIIMHLLFPCLWVWFMGVAGV